MKEATITNIQNNYEGSNSNATNVGPANHMNHQCHFNDALVEENKRLVEDIKKLTDALLKEKDEKIALLSKILSDKNQFPTL